MKSSFLTNLKKRTLNDDNKTSSASFSKSFSSSNSNVNDDIDDIEDDDIRPHKTIKTSHPQISSSPSINYNKSKSTSSSQFSSSGSSSKNKLSQTSPRNSQSNISTSQSNSSNGSNLTATTNLLIDLDDEETKLKCIYGDKCTEKSEYHLKEYYHTSQPRKSDITNKSTSPIPSKSVPSSKQPISPPFNSSPSPIEIQKTNGSPIKLQEDDHDSSLDEILSCTIVPQKKKAATKASNDNITSTNNIDNSDGDIILNTVADTNNNNNTYDDLQILNKPKPLKNTSIIDVPELDENLITKQTFVSKKNKQQQKQKQNEQSTSSNGGSFNISSLNFKSPSTSPQNTPKPLTSTSTSFNFQKPNNNNVNNQKAELWIDKYTPTSESDLVINNKKQVEVKLWLEYRFKEINEGQQISEKLLILTGPSGAGKSTLIRVLSTVMGFDIVEWVNPPMVITKDVNDQLTSPYAPQIEEFRNWIKFSSRGGSLFSKSRLTVLLIEEYPHLISTAYYEFRRAFEEFLVGGRNPMIFIVSDSSNGNSPLYQILPPSVLSNNTVKHINFNSIPPGVHLRLLKKICAIEGYSNIPQQQLEAIAQDSNGDIRASINTLEFFCVGRKQVPTPPKPKSSKKKSNNNNLVDSDDFASNISKDSIDQVKHRDSTLSVFHSIGKILYNKRIITNEDQYKSDCWYKEKYHRYPLENPEPEQVYETSYTGFNNFISFLHENYLTFYQSIDEVSESLDYLSDSDLLVKSEGTENFRITGSRSYNEGSTGGSRDYLPNCSISIALRGFVYPHSQATNRTFFSFLKPRLAQYNEKAISLYDDIKVTIHNNILAPAMNGYRDIPYSLLPTKEFFLQILPYIHLTNFYISKQPSQQPNLLTSFKYNIKTTKTNNFVPLSVMNQPEIKSLLERLCKFSNDAYYKYLSNQDNQIKSSFSSIVTDDDNEDFTKSPNDNINKNNNNNNNANNNRNTNQYYNNNKNNYNNGDETGIKSKLGNNDILNEDDIEDLPD